MRVLYNLLAFTCTAFNTISYVVYCYFKVQFKVDENYKQPLCWPSEKARTKGKKVPRQFLLNLIEKLLRVKDKMSWEIKNFETAVRWPIGRNTIEAVKSMVCSWEKEFFKNLSIFIFNYNEIRSFNSKGCWRQVLGLRTM